MRFLPLKTFRRRSGLLRGVSTGALIAAAAGLILFSGCSQYDQGVGSSIIGDGFQGTLKQDIIPVQRDTTRTIGDYLKGNTVFVPLGEQDGMTSEIVLRYMDFSGLGDTLLAIDSVSLSLHGQGYIDSARITDFSPWHAVVNRIDSDVDLVTLRYGDELDLTPLDTVLVDPADTSEVLDIRIDAETIRRWVDSDTLNFGLLIRPMEGESHSLKKYFVHPSDPNQAALLSISGTIQTGEDVYPDSTVGVRPSTAFFLANDTVTPDDQHILISTGYMREAMLYADFTRYSPTSVSINNVELVVHVDTNWVHTLDAIPDYTWNYLVTDWRTSDPDSAKVGSELNSGAYGTVVPSDTSDVLTFNVTPITRSWVPEPESNYGVLLRGQNEGDVTRRIALFSAEADSALRPYFRVTYTEYLEP